LSRRGKVDPDAAPGLAPIPDKHDDPALFPDSHKQAVIFMLENYEKSLNELMQKTIDGITKKKEELEAVGQELKMLRQAKAWATDEMPDVLDPPPVVE
jgi:hypothetical protein